MIDLRGPFPEAVLEGCETALVLFAAAFHGCQDAAWIERAGILATCIDEDGQKLEEMEQLYPAGWEFQAANAFEFVEQTDRRWDVVTADPWTNMFGECAAMLPWLCGIARRAVVIGTGVGHLRPPDGWVVTGKLRRSEYDGGVFWTTLEPA